MKKFLLSAIGVFISVCAANQLISDKPIGQGVVKTCRDSLPKDGTIISYSYLQKDHTLTDTSLRFKQKLYHDSSKIFRVFR